MLKIIAVDIGGTSTKLGIVNADGAIGQHRRIPTSPPAPDFIEALSTEIEQDSKVDAIAISVAGFLDHAHSAMIYNSNLPWLEGFPLRFTLAKRFHVPVELEIDSNAAAVAEYRFGVGAGSNRFLCLTVGTGIGGGFVANGELVRFTHECLGDVGHVIVEPYGQRCTCGGLGCAEAVATAPAILRARPGADALEEIPADDPVFADSGRKIGLLCASLGSVFFPDRIALAGGVCAASDQVLEQARASFRESAADVMRGTAIVAAKLGAHAPLIGAACKFL
jgi:glucokinase